MIIMELKELIQLKNEINSYSLNDSQIKRAR